MKTQTKNIITGIIIGFMVCFSCLFAFSMVFWIQRTFFYEKGHIANMQDLETGEEIVAILVLDSIPQTAQNIYYAVHLRDQSLRAVFTISQDEFSQWITNNQERWRLKKGKNMSLILKKDIVQCDMQDRTGKLIQVESDFCYTGETSRPARPETINIIYDKNRGLCYVDRSRDLNRKTKFDGI